MGSLVNDGRPNIEDEVVTIPEIILHGDSVSETYNKFKTEHSVDLTKPGYYKFQTSTNTQKENNYSIRLGHFPDFTSQKELNFLRKEYVRSIVTNMLIKKPLPGILRYNYIDKRFEISTDTKLNDSYFHPIAGDFSGNRGKIFKKKLVFSDNNLNLPQNFIINKGENKREFGNIFKEFLTETTIVENKTYEQENLFSNPTFLYTQNDLFDLVQHTLTFSPNDSESYEIFVEKNYTWPIYDFSEHTDISSNLRENGTYKYNFDNNFSFYGTQYSSMYINKLGFFSFTEKVSNLKEITYKNLLKKKRIYYFCGDQDFTYLSKCYIGKGKSKEIVITFLNIFPDEKINPINFQIILWDKNSSNNTNLFNNSSNRINYYADNYEKEGTIKILYNATVNENYLENYNKILVGLSNEIDYLSTTYEPIYFSDLIEKKIDLLNSNGIPNLKTKLILKDDNLSGLNRENVTKYKFDKTNLSSDEVFTTITDIFSEDSSNNESTWGTYYRRNKNDNDFFIKIGEIDIHNLNLSNESKFFLAISSKNDKEYSLKPVLGIVNGYGSMISSNLVEYYSDATQDVLYKNLNDNNKIINSTLKQMDNLFNERLIPFDKEEMPNFFEPLNNEDRKLEFVDLFPVAYSQVKYKNIFDSILYRVQLNKSFQFKTEDYNKLPNSEINSSIFEGLNLKNRNFKGLTIDEEKENDPKYFLKVIFKSVADKIPINNTFNRSFLISEIGLFGPYHLKKNNSSYFKLKLESNKKFLISLVDLIESGSVNSGTKIEIFDANQINYLKGNARYDGSYPEVEIDSENLQTIDGNIIIYVKISSEINIFYYGILFQETI